MINTHEHTFHIPVMGIGFSIDTPLKVAQYGISSVISIVDDILIERMRQYHSQKMNLPYSAITDKMEDFRAKRVTAYLNLIDQLVKEKFEDLKNSTFEKGSELVKYLDMLPDCSNLKQEYQKLLQGQGCVETIKKWIGDHLSAGAIDVNIMTKLDKMNYNKNEPLPIEYNDAHASLRGFANSNLESSIVLSAGINPRLYSYMDNFDDFYPDAQGTMKKKIILKVSDYRSATIQGKYLAKRGLWISEYRVESGLNCGGHAFATDGYLMGPILDEFKNKKDILIQKTFKVYASTLKKRGRICPEVAPKLKITAQGGVGTAEEHQFLLEYYGLDSIGWATPFLLTPEVTNVDETTMGLLLNAKEKDLYLSHISPIGIPFNTVKGNTKDIEKQQLIQQGKPGSVCPKKYLVSNTEFTEKAICTASYRYQKEKIKELDAKNLTTEEHKKQYDSIVEKECICVGLGTPALLVNDVDTKPYSDGVSICPGPNLAYFSKLTSLQTMLGHIYGRTNVIERTDRPSVFINELNVYVDYLKTMIDEAVQPFSEEVLRSINTFQKNLNDGITYYKELADNMSSKFQHLKDSTAREIDKIESKLNDLCAGTA